MKNSLVSSSTSPDDSWGLYLEPRYPCTVEGWRGYAGTIEVHSATPQGTHDYDQVINPLARGNPVDQMQWLLERFPCDFLAASQAPFTPVQWRLLHYIRDCRLSRLGQPDFDPQAALLYACLDDNWLSDVPREFVGADQPTAEIAVGMEQVIAGLTIDQAKAVWAIVAFTWAIRLEKHEVLHLPWWYYHWLLEFVRHARVAA